MSKNEHKKLTEPQNLSKINLIKGITHIRA